MVFDKKEMRAQVGWALMSYEPFRNVQLEKMTFMLKISGFYFLKWTQYSIYEEM